MKRYIVTSATPGCPINEPFLKALKSYASKHKSELLIVPTQAVYKADELDPRLFEYALPVVRDVRLNRNISISVMPINPEQTDPITGLDRLTNKESSTIYASPKQRMKSVASPSSDFPRVIMTPGSCTRPFAKPTKRSLVSMKDHVAGAIIVEVVNSRLYHYRQVQADKDGSFIDIGVQYLPSGKRKRARTSAVIPGDWHTGYTDPMVKQAVKEVCGILDPDYLIEHDFFDGISVNHHIEHKFLTKAKMGLRNNLELELKLCSNELKELSTWARKVVIVKSNHDEFLDRWLDAANYVKDSTNHVLGLELALAKAHGNDPLEVGLRKFNRFNNVKFLRLDESFKLTKKDIEFGAHGHLGPNGSRGSAPSFERSYGRAVIGHSHSPEILRELYVMGTSSHLQMDYNRGPSSWMQTMCVAYENGSRQLINVIRGKWRM